MDDRVGTGHWRLTYDDDGNLISVELWDLTKPGDMIEYEAFKVDSIGKSAFPTTPRRVKI